MKKENIVGVLIVLSTIVITITLCWCIWYFSPASEHNQMVEVYYKGCFYGRFTELEYEKLQKDTYQKYLEFGEQTNSEIIYNDLMPIVSVYYNCSYEQYCYWYINNSDLGFNNIRHTFDGGYFINIYLIVENSEELV